MAPSPSTLDASSAGRTWLGALGVVVATAGLGAAAGPVGVVAGIGIAVPWVLLPGPHAVALGHVVVLPIVGTPSLASLVVLEAGFVAILAAPTGHDRTWPSTLATVGAAAAILGTIAWVGWWRWQPRWLAGAVVAGLVALGLYALHRYAVVAVDVRGAEPWP